MTTALCSACVDLPYYALLLKISRINTFIWHTEDSLLSSIYSQLVQLCWQSIVAVSVGGLIGCAITFFTVGNLDRKRIQMLRFLALVAIFIVIGTSFNATSELGANGTLTVAIIYMLGQIFFAFGMSSFPVLYSVIAYIIGLSTTTYIVSFQKC
jgi:hypothetical protein